MLWAARPPLLLSSEVLLRLPPATARLAPSMSDCAAGASPPSVHRPPLPWSASLWPPAFLGCCAPAAVLVRPPLCRCRRVTTPAAALRTPGYGERRASAPPPVQHAPIRSCPLWPLCSLSIVLVVDEAARAHPLSLGRLRLLVGARVAGKATLVARAGAQLRADPVRVRLGRRGLHRRE